jgi:hypothetical protein
VRFFDFLGNLKKARQASSGQDNLQPTDIQEPDRLLTVLKNIYSRIVSLEVLRVPESVEFEVNFTTSGTPGVVFAHGFESPVRWYLTSIQINSPPDDTPCLTSKADSFDVDGQTKLYWNAASTVTGRAVVRFEPSSFGVRKPA